MPRPDPSRRSPLRTALLAKPTLAGRRVVLRPFSVADAEAMARVLDDDELVRLTGSANGSDDDGSLPLEVLRDWYGSRHEQDDRLDLAMVHPATDGPDGQHDAPVGEVVLNELDEGSRSMNLRILVGRDARDQGLGSEAIRLLLEHAFTALGLHRVHLEVYDFNPRARHVYEKVGFTHEGTLRDALLFDGQWVDAHVMAVLEQEWRSAADRSWASRPTRGPRSESLLHRTTATPNHS